MDRDERGNRGPSPTRRGFLQGTAVLGIGSAVGLDAARAQSDRVVWQFDTDERVSSSPTVVGGTVFVGGWDNTVYALDAESGALIWQYETVGPVVSLTAAEGTVYAGCLNDVYALDGTSGELVWQFETKGLVRPDGTTLSESSPLPTVADVSAGAADGNTVFVGDESALYALDAASGEVDWEFETNEPVRTEPTVADVSAEESDESAGTVFVGSKNPGVYAVDAASGEKRWEFDTGTSVSSPPTVAAGTLFVGSNGGESRTGTLYALDARSGEVGWTFDTDGDIWSSPTVAGGTVFFGSRDGTLYALDAVSGEVGWTYETGDEIWSSPTVVDGTVFVGSWDNHVYALDAGVSGSGDGSRAWLGTEGHHDDWQHAGQSIEHPPRGEWPVRDLGTDPLNETASNLDLPGDPTAQGDSGLVTTGRLILGGGGIAALGGAYALRRFIDVDSPDGTTADDVPRGEASSEEIERTGVSSLVTRRVLIGGWMTAALAGTFVLFDRQDSGAGEQGRSIQTPDGMTVETLFTEDAANSTEIRGRYEYNMSNEVQFPVILSDAERARSVLSNARDVQSFVSETDFDNSYLVTLDHVGSADAELRLLSLRRTSYGIHLEIEEFLPGATRSIHGPLALLVRITDERGSVPEELSLDWYDTT